MTAVNQQHEIASDTVLLSVSRIRENGSLQEYPLLYIPYNIIPLYTTKPCKWLLYCARAICGVDGHLGYANTVISEEGMEEGVQSGDQYLYHLHGEPNYVDINLKHRTSRSSWSSRSRTVPDDLKRYYGGCPFSKFSVRRCRACHLIPHLKGADYYQNIIAPRSNSGAQISVEEKQNMLFMDVGIHTIFDGDMTVGFLKTPNFALKTNELTGAEQASPDEYRLTIHCFSESRADRQDAYHGASSDLRRGCGRRQQPSTSLPDDDDYLPNDVILDLVYGSALLEAWGTQEAKDKCRAHGKKYYGGGLSERDEDRAGDEEELLGKRKKKERSGREVRRSSRLVDKETEEPYDSWDFLLDFNYLIRGTSRAEVEAKRKEQEEREAEEKKQHADEWRKGVISGSPSPPDVMDCDELAGSNGVENSIDSEEAARVDEVLNRAPPRWQLPPADSVPSLTSMDSGSADSESTGSLSRVVHSLTRRDHNASTKHSHHGTSLAANEQLL